MDKLNAEFKIFARPPVVIDLEQEEKVRISMERKRIANQFPWKRKGYRKHVK